MNRFLSAIALALATAGTTYAAAPVFAWALQGNGTTVEGFDYGIGTKADIAGNVYLVWNRYNGLSPNDFQDIGIVKFNSAGIVQWEATIDLHGFDDRAYDMDVDAAGNVYLTGFTSLDGTNTNTNVIAVKYNTAGVLQYANEYVPGANDKDEYAYGCVSDAAGNLIIVGEAASAGGQFSFDCMVRRIGPAGVNVWVNTLPGANAGGYDAYRDVEIAPNGDPYVCGEVDNTAVVDDGEGVIARYTFGAGAQVFSNAFNSGIGASYDYFTSIAVDNSNNGWAVGGTFTAYAPTVLSRALIFKVNNAGGAVGFQQFNGTGTGQTAFNDVIVNPATTFAYAAGETMTGVDEPTNNILLVRYTAAVALAGSNTYNGPGADEDVAASVAFDSAGDVIVGGTTDMDAAAIAANRNVALVGFSPTTLGQLYAVLYNFAANDWDYLESMRTGRDGGIYIAGNSYVTFTNSAALVGKYIQTNRVNPFSFQIVLGTPFGGALADLFTSNNNYVFILNDETTPNTEIRFFGTSPTATPSNIVCRFEAGSDRNDLSQFTDAFRFSTGTWVNHAFQLSTLADSSYNFTLIAAVAPTYVGPANEVRTRIRWVPTVDLEAADGWSERVDVAVWDINN